MENQEILMPDYNHSILNLINSILKNFNVKTEYSTLPNLDDLLTKKYKNIVLLILDGMGENVLKYSSPNGFFMEHHIDTITSIYPSTTAAALTTFYSGKPPIKTGWIAWSQYFKEYGRNIDMLPYVDSYTKETLPRNKFDVYKELNYETVYEQIEKSTPNVKTYEIKPSHCDAKTDKCIHAKNFEGICDSIETLCKNNKQKYIFAYFDSPDNINHKNGWNSDATKDFILYAEEKIKKLVQNLENSDTLIIISADHGHNNISTNYFAFELEDLSNCYIMPPSFEHRCISFWIKKDKMEYFENKFKQKFKNEFILYSKKEFIDSNLLGVGEMHKKVDDFIGDFIAVAISDSAINLDTCLSPEKPLKLSSHCGLTKNEMEVPLIIFDKK